jgi:hypothetical protein
LRPMSLRNCSFSTTALGSVCEWTDLLSSTVLTWSCCVYLTLYLVS